MKIPEIPEETLRKLDVAIVYLFGSFAHGHATPLSDIDIGIVFHKPETTGNPTDIYTTLYDIFTDILPGCKEVDIVFLQQKSPVFQYNVFKDAEVVYQSNPTFRADYEEQVTKEYLDFEPVLQQFSEALLSRK